MTRAVVYCYTQTGQLREVTDVSTAPLVENGWTIRTVDVQPRVAFPFPGRSGDSSECSRHPSTPMPWWSWPIP